VRLDSGYENRRARIEIIPLIDIVFLLLVFFIYAMLSMTVHRGLRVELPSAATAQVDKRDYVDISIDQENRIFVNGSLTTLDDLTAKVIMDKNRKKPVFISGDQRADLGLAIRVLDRLRKAGISDVSFETRLEE
jgi:biopolymer transport protein ExbD